MGKWSESNKGKTLVFSTMLQNMEPRHTFQNDHSFFFTTGEIKEMQKLSTGQ
jgi:hypothetical protein